MPRPYDHHDYIAEDAADRRLALQYAAQLAPETEWAGRAPALTGFAGELYAWLRARPSIAPARLILTAGVPAPQNQGDSMTAQLNLQDNQDVTFTVAAQDAKGFPAADGPYTWASPDDPTGQFIALTPSSDTTSCTVTAVAPGQGTVQVTDPSGISGAELVVVTAGPVASITLTAGTPAAQ